VPFVCQGIPQDTAANAVKRRIFGYAWIAAIPDAGGNTKSMLLVILEPQVIDLPSAGKKEDYGIISRIEFAKGERLMGMKVNPVMLLLRIIKSFYWKTCLNSIAWMPMLLLISI
jgi:hypothetical protein